MRFVTQKTMAGVLKLAVVMPGVEFIVRTMTKSADVGNFASQVYGVRQLTHQIMPGKFEG